MISFNLSVVFKNSKCGKSSFRAVMETLQDKIGGGGI